MLCFALAVPRSDSVDLALRRARAETSIPDDMTKGWTFQSLIDAKMTVTAYCHNSACHHRQPLDLAKLRDRFGPDAPAMADDPHSEAEMRVVRVLDPSGKARRVWGRERNGGSWRRNSPSTDIAKSLQASG